MSTLEIGEQAPRREEAAWRQAVRVSWVGTSEDETGGWDDQTPGRDEQDVFSGGVRQGTPFAQIRLIAAARYAPKAPVQFIDWEGLAPRDRTALEDAGLSPWPLPALSLEQTQGLLEEYCAVTAEIGSANGGHTIWWYTWTSCRDRYYSKLLEHMEFLARLKVSRGSSPASPMVLVCPDPELASAISHMLSTMGVSVRRGMMDRFRWWFRRLGMWVSPWVIGARVVRRALLDHLVLADRQRRPSSMPSAPREARVLLITWLRNQDLAGPIPLATYFGRLPQVLHEQRIEVAIFGGLMESATRRSSATHSSGVRVESLPERLRLTDLVRAYLIGLLGRIRIPMEGPLRDPQLRKLVRRDIHLSRGISVVYAILMEQALQRFVRVFEPAKVVQICENNPWERACTRAVSTGTHQPELVGYLHCAAVLSHTKYILTDRDRLVRPRPRQLICTGERPRQIMIRYTGHTPEEVLAGCTWRFEYLHQQPARRSIRWHGNILVVLEGLPSMIHLIWFMHRALAGQTAIKAVLRAHPQYGLERLLDEASLSLDGHPTLSASRHRNLWDDFEAADLVVYKGSTAAIEAGYLGIPLIHVKTHNILTDDPLFEISVLKRTVSHPRELLPAVTELTSLSEEIFRQSVTSFRRYVDAYLASPTKDAISLFGPSVNGEVR